MLGVSHTTIQTDLSDGKNLPPAAEESRNEADAGGEDGKNLPPESFVQASGREIAEEAQAIREAHERRETKRAETLVRLEDPTLREINDQPD